MTPRPLNKNVSCFVLLQSFTTNRVCSRNLQGSVHHTTSQEFSMDPSDARSYRPISNLPVVSKLLERIVAKQLLTYLDTSQLMPELQSAYRPCHSTETAITKVLSDVFSAIDNGSVAALVL